MTLERINLWANTAIGLLFIFALCLTSCDGNGDDDNLTPDSGMMTPKDSGTTTPMDSGMMSSLYDRLGGESGITTVIGGFVGRVVADPKINGFFLNSSVNNERLGKCLIKFVGAATGGPQTYPGTGQAADADGCRSMKETHTGMGVSTTDFTDLAGHLVAELQAQSVAQSDIDAIVAALTPLAEDIVENPNDNETIYLRAGRKPAVQIVISDFVARVVADAAINGFFLNSSLNGDRLGTCLVRQVCAATGGPCKYGEEVAPELFNGTPCRDMTATHLGLGISADDFTDLAGHLVDALQAAGVAQADIDAVVAAVAPLSDQIVENPNNDETIYLRAGRKPAVQVVINDFVGRVLADPAINGYFLNNSLNGDRLGTCLVRQVCGATGGPCRYGEEAGPELFNDAPCRDMLSTHDGLGISTADFNDLAGHLVAALQAAGVVQADIDGIVAAIGPLAGDIVEDVDSSATIYQRLGRKPAIATVINDFAGRVLGDASLNGFFSATNANRLGTCLVRQVCSATGGPCRYGLEAGPELIDGTPCRDMVTTHTGLTSPVGGAGAPITKADFDTLVGHLIDSLDTAGVETGDRDAIVNTLAPLCPQIVANGTGC